jgi:DNA-directed RNA polymerase specialized sigma24 family protein
MLLLESLSVTDRTILYLSAVERWSYRAIANLVEMREATVRGRASRAMRRLRGELSAQGAEQ